MPYYIYAIYTDPETDNLLLQAFAQFREAREYERKLSDATGAPDKYFVRMVVADADFEADEIANVLRPHPKLK